MKSTLNEDTNALAARLDTLEIAEGSTVTRATLDVLADVSARLKALGVPAVVAADAPPAATPAKTKA